MYTPSRTQRRPTPVVIERLGSALVCVDFSRGLEVSPGLHLSYPTAPLLQGGL